MINLGVAYASLERYEEALKIFDAILASNPDEIYAHFNKAILLILVNNWQHENDVPIIVKETLLKIAPDQLDNILLLFNQCA